MPPIVGLFYRQPHKGFHIALRRKTATGGCFSKPRPAPSFSPRKYAGHPHPKPAQPVATRCLVTVKPDAFSNRNARTTPISCKSSSVRIPNLLVWTMFWGASGGVVSMDYSEMLTRQGQGRLNITRCLRKDSTYAPKEFSATRSTGVWQAGAWRQCLFDKGVIIGFAFEIIPSLTVAHAAHRRHIGM